MSDLVRFPNRFYDDDHLRYYQFEGFDLPRYSQHQHDWYELRKTFFYVVCRCACGTTMRCASVWLRKPERAVTP